VKRSLPACTGQISPAPNGENSSPVSEAWRKFQSRLGGLRKKSSPIPAREKKIQSRLGGPPGRPGRIFFRGPAGPGRDWIFYFAGGDGTGFFFRGAPNFQSRRHFFRRQKKSSPVDLKNPVPSGALLLNIQHRRFSSGACNSKRRERVAGPLQPFAKLCCNPVSPMPESRPPWLQSAPRVHTAVPSAGHAMRC